MNTKKFEQLENEERIILSSYTITILFFFIIPILYYIDIQGTFNVFYIVKIIFLIIGIISLSYTLFFDRENCAGPWIAYFLYFFNVFPYEYVSSTKDDFFGIILF